MKPFERRRLDKLRRELLSGLSGEILEVGAGTGVNFPYYPEGAHVLALEPANNKYDTLQKKKAESDATIRIITGGVGDAPIDDLMATNSMDHIICTLVLCTIPDLEGAFERFMDWLKPGGQLLVLEHIRSSSSWKGRVQDLVTPVWKLMADGCHLNRNTDEMLKEKGFHLEEEKYLGTLVPWYYARFRK